MSPQGDLTLLVVHSPHTTTPKPRFYSHNSSNPPTLFPTTCTTQGMYPLHCSQSLRLYHSFIRASSALGWPGISQLGTLGTLSASGVLTTTFTRLLSPFPQQENALQAYNPFYRHTCLFSQHKTQPNNGFLQAQHGWCSSQHSTPLLLPKICM
jgi:hypothetical protein